MKRRTFLKAAAAGLKAAAAGSLIFIKGCSSGASRVIDRVRPGDAAWPSADAWNRLDDSVGGNLIEVHSPLTAAAIDPAARAKFFANVKNPYYLSDDPALTQTLGWVDAWTSQPSVYAVEARNATDVAATVNFARKNDLRLVVKGGGHSYQGTSNAPDSLLIWTRRMDEIVMHDSFVPKHCETEIQPQRAVTMGAGIYSLQAYEAVTTKVGAYVQGGGCTNVGFAGLCQSGGFGNFSKYYGTVASNLLEAEVVTADGEVLTANACTNADLFWALKGGGGGTFGIITKLTLQVHELPEWAGSAELRVSAHSDDAFRRLITQFGGIHLTGPVERRSSPGAICWRAFQARRVPAYLRRRGSHSPGPPGGDEVLVAYRVVGYGEFEHAVEDHTAAAGAPAVEAEHELIQVAGQVRRLHRALVGAQQPAFGQRDDPMHRWQERAGVLAAGSGRPLATSVMDIADLLEPAVARPAVGDHRRARLNVICHEGVQRGGRRIGQRQHPAPADAFRRLDLHGDAGQHLLAPGSTAGQPRLLTADVGLIHLHHPG